VALVAGRGRSAFVQLAAITQQAIDQPLAADPDLLVTLPTVGLISAGGGIHFGEWPKVVTVEGGVYLGFEDGGAGGFRSFRRLTGQSGRLACQRVFRRLRRVFRSLGARPFHRLIHRLNNCAHSPITRSGLHTGQQCHLAYPLTCDMFLDLVACSRFGG